MENLRGKTMKRRRRQHSDLKARLGMCLIVAIGLPSFAFAQTVPSAAPKAAAAPAQPAAIDSRDVSFIEKLRALRTANGGYPRPPSTTPAAAPTVAPIVEQPTGLLSRFRPQQVASPAPQPAAAAPGPAPAQ